jgi:hypothetical protein
MSDDAWNLI